MRTGLHNASVSLSRNIASVRTSSNIPRYMSAFASNVMGAGDEVSHVMSVSTVLRQCTGKVVRLNTQFEITYSTTVVEFNTTMALVVLMERCNFVSAGTDTEATGHFTLQTMYKGVPHLYYLSERRGLVVKKLDSQTYNWRFEANRRPV